MTRAADVRGAAGLAGRPPVFLSEPGALAGEVIVLSGQEGWHAAAVRRLTRGERVDVADGAGRVAECVVAAARPGRLELAVRARREEPWPQPALVVVQAIPKGERGQLAVELMTEAGVDVIVPWQADRCVTRWHGERAERALARWRVTAREAAKQARRAWLPQITEPAALAEVTGRVRSAALAVVLDPAGGAALAGQPLPNSGEMVVVVGPEGGVSPAEAEALTAAGALTCRLGPTVLRTSTAGTVAAAVLLSRSERWG